MSKHPSVIWAQREENIFVTIEVDDAKIEDLKIEGDNFHFIGTSHGQKYETTMQFFEAVKGEETKRANANTRVVELMIPKAEPKWWPRLLKDKGKVHWLKVDFNKWIDEDEEEEVGPSGAPAAVQNGFGDFDLNQYMSALGGGAGAPPDFDGLEEDGDDDEMPDLEDNEEEGAATNTKEKATVTED